MCPMYSERVRKYRHHSQELEIINIIWRGIMGNLVICFAFYWQKGFFFPDIKLQSHLHVHTLLSPSLYYSFIKKCICSFKRKITCAMAVIGQTHSQSLKALVHILWAAGYTQLYNYKVTPYVFQKYFHWFCVCYIKRKKRRSLCLCYNFCFIS